MNRIIFMLLATLMMFASVPVYAQDATTNIQTSNMQKDECVLASKECKGIVDSIKKKAEKLNTEIEKGTKVYTPDELKTLKTKLKEAETLLDNYLND